ncbi:MAG: CvpA family protein [Ruminococcaceae bacterium]|nr:CvpA family protein [Oscillospiraceae bacterium]
MDNAFVIDALLAAILILGAMLGARRGLFKSLMGLVVVIAALIGSVILAGMLTGPVTDIAAPKVEDAVVAKFSDAVDKVVEENSAEAYETIDALLDEYGAAGSWARSALEPLRGTVSGSADAAKEKVTESFRSAISPGVRKVVRGVVHTVLLLVLYPVLLFVFRLLVQMVDHVFDLPVLGTVNDVGGAIVGLIEAALMLHVAVYIASHLGLALVTENVEGAKLLPIFLNHSPVELFSSFTREG